MIHSRTRQPACLDVGAKRDGVAKLSRLAKTYHEDLRGRCVLCGKQGFCNLAFLNRVTSIFDRGRGQATTKRQKRES